MWPFIAVLRLSFLIASTQVFAEPLVVKEITDGVFVHIGKHNDFDEKYDGDIANIGFIVGKKSVAVIDSGGSFKTGAALREAIRAHTDLPIRYVINTHIHPDHIFGNAAFEQDNPEFIGHNKLPATLEANRDAMMSALNQELGKNAEGSRIVIPTRTVSGSLDIDLGERTIHLQTWPKAHTNTDLTVLDETTKTLWTGDLLFITRTPSLDGDLKGWIAVIDALKKIKARETIPGHGEPTDNKNTMLVKEQTYLNVLLTGVRKAIKDGVDMQKAIETVGQSEKDNWVLFEMVNPRNVNIAYPQLEWE